MRGLVGAAGGPTRRLLGAFPDVDGLGPGDRSARVAMSQFVRGDGIDRSYLLLTDPVREGARLHLVDDRPGGFIDRVGAEQRDAADDDRLVFLGGAGHAAVPCGLWHTRSHLNLGKKTASGEKIEPL